MAESEHSKQLIDLIIQPVIIVSRECQFVSANTEFKQDPELSEHIDSLLNAVTPLISGQEELIYWQNGGREKVLTSMPLQQNQCLIKIANSKHLALTKRYHNLIGAINQMSDAILIIDHHFKIDVINDQFSEMFPFITKHHQGTLNALELIEKVASYLSKNNTVSERKIFRFLRFKLNNNHECNLPFTMPNGQFYSYRDSLTLTGERSGLCINESQFKELNDQLETAFNEATELSDAKSNFMAAMSHEVRTPLNAIIGLVDLCMVEPTLKNHEYINRMRRSAMSLLNLVNDVLDFTKFDANKVQLSKANIHLRSFCEKVIDSFAGQAQSKHTELMLFVDPLLPQYVIADDVRLNQILYNLMSNGLKFNDKASPELWLKVSLDKLTGYTTFSVKDNGIGIKKSQQTSIFDRFSQANQNIHHQYGGTGIGLSLCQKICHMMEGDIYVISQEGEGAEFILQLPLQSSIDSELSKIDYSQLKDKIVITNDRSFYQVMALYSGSLELQVTYKQELPNILCSDEILCVNKDLLDDFAKLYQYPINQVILLMDAIIEGVGEDFHKIHRTPVRLEQILSLFQSTVAQQPTTIGTRPSSKLLRANQRVLVVEDNTDNMFVLKKQFQTLGIDASFALTPEDAVIFFEQQKYDVVISDYQMPGVSGAQLLQILRDTEHDEKRPAALMVILTADKTKRCNQACFAAGANKIIMKPLTIDNLILLLNDNAEAALHNQQALKGAFNSQDILLDTGNTVDISGEENGTDQSDIFYAEDIGLFEDVKNPQKIMQIESLRSIMGYTDEQEERQYLSGYAENLKSITQDMEQAFTANDYSSLGKLAHSLKSSALIIGASYLSHQCENLEVSCAQRHKDSHQTSGNWQQVQSIIEQVINHIDEYCSNET